MFRRVLESFVSKLNCALKQSKVIRRLSVMRFQVFLFTVGVLNAFGFAVDEHNEDGHDHGANSSIYQFQAVDADGNVVSMEKYRGKVVIFVNVASDCGLTTLNYGELKELLQTYKSEGLEVAAFPCNQFHGQEPGSEKQIKAFIQKTFDFEPDLYAKVDVNGPKAHPIFTFLKEKQPGTLVNAVKWNFTKWIVNRDGEVIARYGPHSPPSSMIADIEMALRKVEL
ncbi:Glutathione peroxidase [Aphelenchoides besseyi]|nr:Glutathione peroxidase [Aphelenchoides besseyi]